MNDPLNIIIPEKEEVEESKEQDVDILHKVVEEILSTKNLDTKTDLNDKMVVSLAKLDLYGEYFDIDIVRMLSANIKRLRISRNRLGRLELKEMTRNLISYDQPSEEPSILSKLFKGSKDY